MRWIAGALLLGFTACATPSSELVPMGRDSKGTLVLYDPLAKEDRVYLCEYEATTGTHSWVHQCREADQKELERRNAQEWMRRMTSNIPPR